jgi:hypothetical protein
VLPIALAWLTSALLDGLAARHRDAGRLPAGGPYARLFALQARGYQHDLPVWTAGNGRHQA